MISFLAETGGIRAPHKTYFMCNYACMLCHVKPRIEYIESIIDAQQSFHTILNNACVIA